MVRIPLHRSSHRLTLAGERKLLQKLADRPKPQPPVKITPTCIIDLEACCIYCKGRIIALSPQEVRLLTPLVDQFRRAPHVPCRIDFLIDVVFLEKSKVYDKVHALHQIVSRVREKLDDDPGNPRYLLNHRGIGYRLCAE